MKTTTALLLLLGLALPGVSRPDPCEVEVAQIKKDLDAVREAIATIERVPPGDTRDQMLAGAKARYDQESRRLKEAQGNCGGPEAAAPAAVVVPPPPTPAPAPVVVVPPPPPAPTAVVPAPAVAAPAAPAAPCLTGCGKDTDCKGDRICVKGECVDPPAKRDAPR